MKNFQKFLTNWNFMNIFYSEEFCKKFLKNRKLKKNQKSHKFCVNFIAIIFWKIHKNIFIKYNENYVKISYKMKNLWKFSNKLKFYENFLKRIKKKNQKFMQIILKFLLEIKFLEKCLENIL